MAENVVGNVGLGMFIDDSAMDAVYARQLARAKAFRQEMTGLLSLPMNGEGASLMGGGATLGMSPSQRMAAGPGAFRMSGGTVGGGTGIGTSSFSGGVISGPVRTEAEHAIKAEARATTRVAEAKERVARTIDTSISRTTAEGAAQNASIREQLFGPAREAAGRLGTSATGAAPSLGAGTGAGTLAAGAFAAFGVAHLVGTVQDMHAQQFLRDRMTQDQQMQSIMGAAQSDMMGISGAGRRILGRASEFLFGGKSEFNDEGRYDAAFQAQLGMQKVSLNTQRLIEQRQAQTQMDFHEQEIRTINDPNRAQAANKMVMSRARAQRQGVQTEAVALQQELIDAQSQNDIPRIQQTTSKIGTYLEQRPRRLAQIDDEERESLALIKRENQQRHDLMDQQLSTEHAVIEAGLMRSPSRARLRQLVGGYDLRAMQLSFNPDDRKEYEQTRRNEYGAVALERQNYLDSFQGVQVGKFATDHDAKDAEDPAKVLREIQLVLIQLQGEIAGFATD